MANNQLDWDRHSWCGAFVKDPRLNLYLPLGALQLDRADRSVMRVADERDAVQKKTFTKWVNKHLVKVQRHLIHDLFEDLRDGVHLISLLEVLSHRRFSRERGRMRCHMIQNVQTVLNYLNRKRIKYVNIRADEIVDGNPKLTLGLVWTFILHFQVGDVVDRGEVTTDALVREALMSWCQRMTEGYPGVKVKDFSKSWKDGLAFLALLHKHRPDLIDFTRARHMPPRTNLARAFEVAEDVYGVTPLLDPEDVDVPEPDEKSIITYVSFLYDLFPDHVSNERSNRENDCRVRMEEYQDLASQLSSNLSQAILALNDHNFPNNLPHMKRVLSEFQRFQTEGASNLMRSRQKLMNLNEEIKLLSIGGRPLFSADNPLHMDNINKLWTDLVAAQQHRDTNIRLELARLERRQRVADKLNRDLISHDNTLKNIQKKINQEMLKHQQTMTSAQQLISKQAYEGLLRSLKSTETALTAIHTEAEGLEGCCGAHDVIHKTQDLQSKREELADIIRRQLTEHLSSSTSQQPSDSPVDGSSSELLLAEIVEANEWVKKMQNKEDNEGYGMEVGRPGVLTSPTLGDINVNRVAEFGDVRKRRNEQIMNFENTLSHLSQQKKNLKTTDNTKKLNEELYRLQQSYSHLKSTSNRNLKQSHSIASLSSQLEDMRREIARVKDDIDSHPWNVQDLAPQDIQTIQQNVAEKLRNLEGLKSNIAALSTQLTSSRHPTAVQVRQVASIVEEEWKTLHHLVDFCMQTHLSTAESHHNFFNKTMNLRRLMAAQSKVLSCVQQQLDDESLEGTEELLIKLQRAQKAVAQLHKEAQDLKQQGNTIPPTQVHMQLPHNTSTPHLVSVKSLLNQKPLGIYQGDSCLLDTSANQKTNKWSMLNKSGNEVLSSAVSFQVNPRCRNIVETIDSVCNDIEVLETSCDEEEGELKYKMMIATIDMIKSWQSFQLPGGAGSEQILSMIDSVTVDGEDYFQQLRRQQAKKRGNQPRIRQLEDYLQYCKEVAEKIKMTSSQGSIGVSMETSMTFSGEQVIDNKNMTESTFTNTEYDLPPPSPVLHHTPPFSPSHTGEEFHDSHKATEGFMNEEDEYEDDVYIDSSPSSSPSTDPQLSPPSQRRHGDDDVVDVSGCEGEEDDNDDRVKVFKRKGEKYDEHDDFEDVEDDFDSNEAPSQNYPQSPSKKAKYISSVDVKDSVDEPSTCDTDSTAVIHFSSVIPASTSVATSTVSSDPTPTSQSEFHPPPKPTTFTGAYTQDKKESQPSKDSTLNFPLSQTHSTNSLSTITTSTTTASPSKPQKSSPAIDTQDLDTDRKVTPSSRANERISTEETLISETSSVTPIKTTPVSKSTFHLPVTSTVLQKALIHSPDLMTSLQNTIPSPTASSDHHPNSDNQMKVTTPLTSEDANIISHSATTSPTSSNNTSPKHTSSTSINKVSQPNVETEVSTSKTSELSPHALNKTSDIESSASLLPTDDVTRDSSAITPISSSPPKTPSSTQQSTAKLQTITRLKQQEIISPETHGYPMMLNRSERIVGFFQPSSLFDSACPLSLVDCIKTDIMKEGLIKDIFSNTFYTPSQAVDLGLVDSSLDRFVDPRNNNVLSYEKAVKNKLFDPHSGLMASKSDGNFDMDLEEALQRGLVFKSLLASDAILKYSLPTGQKEVVVVVPRIGTAENPRLKEVLDQESKSLIRTSDGAFLSFKELALDMPVVFKLLNQGDIQLLDRNFARVHKPVANFKASRSEKYKVDYLTLPQALEENVLQIREDAVHYVFMHSNKISLDDAAKRNFISAELYHLMTRSYIELSPGRCISVPEAVRQGLVDWHNGMINTEEGPLTFEEMYERDMMDDITASNLVIMSCSFAVVTSIITSIQHQSTPLQSTLTQETLFTTEDNEEKSKDDENKISSTSERHDHTHHKQFPSSTNKEQFQENNSNKTSTEIEASPLNDNSFSKIDNSKTGTKYAADSYYSGETTTVETIHPASRPEDSTSYPASRPEDVTSHPASRPEDVTSYPASRPEDSTSYPASRPEDATSYPTSRPEDSTSYPTSRPEDATSYPTSRPEDDAKDDDYDTKTTDSSKTSKLLDDKDKINRDKNLFGEEDDSRSSLKNISTTFKTPKDEPNILESSESNDPTNIKMNKNIEIKDLKNRDEFQVKDDEIGAGRRLDVYKLENDDLQDKAIIPRDEKSQSPQDASIVSRGQPDDKFPTTQHFDAPQTTDHIDKGSITDKDSINKDGGFKEEFKNIGKSEAGSFGETRRSIDELMKAPDTENIKPHGKSYVEDNDDTSVVSADQYQDAENLERKTNEEDDSKSAFVPNITKHSKAPIAHERDQLNEERKEFKQTHDWEKDPEKTEVEILTDLKSSDGHEETPQRTEPFFLKPSTTPADDDVDSVISADQFQDAQVALSDEQSNSIPTSNILEASHETPGDFDATQSTVTTSKSEDISKKSEDYDNDLHDKDRNPENNQKDTSFPDRQTSGTKVEDETGFTNRTDDIEVKKNASFVPKDGLKNKSESITLSIDENSVRIDVPSERQQPHQPHFQPDLSETTYKPDEDTIKIDTNEDKAKNEKVSLVISKNKVELNIDIKGKDLGEDSDSSQFQDAVQPDNEINYFSDEFKKSFKPPATTIQSVDSSPPTTQPRDTEDYSNKETRITSDELPRVSPTTDPTKSFDDRDNLTNQYDTSHKTSDDTTKPVLKTQEDESRVELVGDQIKSKNEVKPKDTNYKEDEEREERVRGSIEGPRGVEDSIAPSVDLSPHFDEPSEGADRSEQAVVEGSSGELSGGRVDGMDKFKNKSEIFVKNEDGDVKYGSSSNDVDDWKDPSDFKDFHESSVAKVEDEVKEKIDKIQKEDTLTGGSGEGREVLENENKVVTDDIEKSIQSDKTIIDKSDESENADKTDDEINDEFQKDAEVPSEVSGDEFEDSVSKPEETSNFSEKKEKILDDKTSLKETGVQNDIIGPANDEEKLNNIVRTTEQENDDVLPKSEISGGLRDASMKGSEDGVNSGYQNADKGGVSRTTVDDKGETSESDIEQYKDAVLYNEQFEKKINTSEDSFKDDKTADSLKPDQDMDSDLSSKRGSFQDDFHSATDNLSERTDSRRPSSSEKPSDVESSDTDWNDTHENFEIIKKDFESMEDEEKTEVEEVLDDDLMDASIGDKPLLHEDSFKVDTDDKNLPEKKQNNNIQDNDDVNKIDKFSESNDSNPNELPNDIVDSDAQKTALSLGKDINEDQMSEVSDFKSDIPGEHELSSTGVVQSNEASTINQDLPKEEGSDAVSKMGPTSDIEALGSNDDETIKTGQTANIQPRISGDDDQESKPNVIPPATIPDESQKSFTNNTVPSLDDNLSPEDKPISSQISISKDVIPSQKIPLNNENENEDDVSVVHKEKPQKSLSFKQSETPDDKSDGLSKAKAVGLGLMAVVGAPIVAGMAIAEAFKSIPPKHPEVFKEHHPENLRTHGRYEESNEGELTPTNENAISPSDFQERITTGDNFNLIDTESNLQKNIESGLVKDDAKQRENESYSKENIHTKSSIDDSDNKMARPSEWKPNSPLAVILQNDNFYDAKNNKFINPTNGSLMDLKECMEMGLLDVEDKNIADLESGEVIGLLEAVERGLINANECLYHADDLNNLPLLEAFNNGLIMDDSVSEFGSVEHTPVTDGTIHDDDSRSATKAGANGASVDVIKHAPRSCSIVEAVISKIYNPHDNTVMDYLSNRNFTLVEALDRGLVTTRTTVFQDPGSGKKVCFEQLLRKGCVSLKSGDIALEGGGFMRIAEAVDKGYLTDEGESRSDGVLERPLSLVKILELSLYDSVTGHFIDPDTEERMTLAEALDENLLDPLTAVLNDPGSEKVFSLEEALMRGLVSDRTGAVYDTQARKKISLIEATRRAIVIPLPMTLNMAVDIGLFNEETGMFYDPTCGMCFALQEAIDNGLIDSRSLIVDPATGKVMAIAVATACGILDARNGNVINMHTGQVFSLKDVVLVSSSTPMSRENSIENNRLSVIHEEDSLSTTSSSSGVSSDKLHRNLPKDAAIADEGGSNEYVINGKKVRDDVFVKEELKDEVKDSDEYLSADSLQEGDDNKNITFKKSPTKTFKKGEDKQTNKDRFENKSVSFTERRSDSPEMRIKPKDRKKEISLDKNIKTKFVTDSSNIQSPESTVHSNKTKLVPSLGTPKMSVKERGRGADLDGGSKKFGLDHAKRLEDRLSDTKKEAGLRDKLPDKGEDFFDAPLPRFDVAKDITDDKDDDIEKYFGRDEKKDVEEMTSDEMLKTLQRHKNWLLQMEKKLVEQTIEYKGLDNDRDLMHFFNVVKKHNETFENRMNEVDKVLIGSSGHITSLQSNPTLLKQYHALTDEISNLMYSIEHESRSRLQMATDLLDDKNNMNMLTSDLDMVLNRLEEVLKSCSSTHSDAIEHTLKTLQELQQDAQDSSGELSKITQLVDNFTSMTQHLEDKLASYEPTLSPKRRPALTRSNHDNLQSSIKMYTNRIASLSSSSDQLYKKLQQLQQHSSSFADQYDNMISWFEKAYDIIHTIHKDPDAQEKDDSSKDLIAALMRDGDMEMKKLKSTAKDYTDNMKKVGCSGAEVDEVNNKVKVMADKLQLMVDDSEGLSVESFYKPVEPSDTSDEQAILFNQELEKVLVWLQDVAQITETLSTLPNDPPSIKCQIKIIKALEEQIQPQQNVMLKLNETACQLPTIHHRNLHHAHTSLTKLLNFVSDKKQSLSRALLYTGDVRSSIDDVNTWVGSSRKLLRQGAVNEPPTKWLNLLKRLEKEGRQQQAHLEDIKDKVNSTADLIDADSYNEELQKLTVQLDELNKEILQNLEQSQDFCDRERMFKERAAVVKQALDRLLPKVNSSMQTFALLPSKLQLQEKQFKKVLEDVNSTGSLLLRVMDEGEELMPQAPKAIATALKKEMDSLTKLWLPLKAKCEEKTLKLAGVSEQVVAYHSLHGDCTDWLNEKESYFKSLKPCSRYLPSIINQVHQHKELHGDMDTQRSNMQRLESLQSTLRSHANRQDISLLNNMTNNQIKRWEKLVQKFSERTRQMENANKEAKLFHDSCKNLEDWLFDMEVKLTTNVTAGEDSEVDWIREEMERHKRTQRQLTSKQPTLDAIVRMGRMLKERSSQAGDKEGVGKIAEVVGKMRNKWNHVNSLSQEKQKHLEDNLLLAGRFNDAIELVLDWLSKVEPTLSETSKVDGDVDTVRSLIDHHKFFQKELLKKTASVAAVKQAAEKLLMTSSDEQLVAAKLKDMVEKWDRVCYLSVSRQERLKTALEKSEDFHNRASLILDWLNLADQQLSLQQNPLHTRQQPQQPIDLPTHLQDLLDDQTCLDAELDGWKEKMDECLEMGSEVLNDCHPDGVASMRQWMSTIKNRFHEVTSASAVNKKRLSDALKKAKMEGEVMDVLLGWLGGIEKDLDDSIQSPLPHNLPILEQLKDNHALIESELLSRQAEVERFSMAARKTCNDRHPYNRNRFLNSKRKGLAGKVGSAKMEELRDRRCGELFNKWRTVWLKCMERGKNISAAVQAVDEEERLERFDFDVWRLQYSEWMRMNKNRAMDCFYRADRDRDGKLNKDQLIDAILKSGFRTTRGEMGKVLERFELNKDGLLDYREFVAALRWPEKLRSRYDGGGWVNARIRDEVQKETNKCKCPRPFNVLKVANDRYRFGESQKLRLVRILRSTVMVRVGGGWVALDEFLVKNDPCRGMLKRNLSIEHDAKSLDNVTDAKGRTNQELRDSFLLPIGSNQALANFKTKTPSKSLGDVSNRFSRSPLTHNKVAAAGRRQKLMSPMLLKKTARENHDHSKSDFSLDGSGLHKRGSLPSGHSQRQVQASPLIRAAFSGRKGSLGASRTRQESPKTFPSNDDEEDDEEVVMALKSSCCSSLDWSRASSRISHDLPTTPSLSNDSLSDLPSQSPLFSH